MNIKNTKNVWKIHLKFHDKRTKDRESSLASFKIVRKFVCMNPHTHNPWGLLLKPREILSQSSD